MSSHFVFSTNNQFDVQSDVQSMSFHELGSTCNCLSIFLQCLVPVFSFNSYFCGYRCLGYIFFGAYVTKTHTHTKCVYAWGGWLFIFLTHFLKPIKMVPYCIL
jgi:hypothetical protein